MKKLHGIIEGITSVRIHIPTGDVLRIVFATLYLCGVAVTPLAAQAPKKLVTAQNASWKTSAHLFVAPDATAPATVHIGDSTCPTPDATIVPGGSLKIDRVSDQLCNVTDFMLIPAPSIPAFTLLSFDDGTNRSSMTIPAIGAVDAAHPAFISGLANDNSEGTYITCFNDASLSLTFYGPDNKLLGTEGLLCHAPVTQFRPLTTLHSGRVVIRAVSPGFGPCAYCADGGQAYGFVSVASPVNANARVYVFGAQ